MAPAVPAGLQPRSAEELAAVRAMEAQQRRRSEALLRQKASRHDAVAHARQLALHALSADDGAQRADARGAEVHTTRVETHAGGAFPPPVEDDDMPVDETIPGRPRRRKSDAADVVTNALMLPEWLLDVPPDLPTAWLVAPRPEGTRCVVVAARGATAARRRDGSALVRRFPSQLPAGSNATAEALDSVTILDCILHEADQTFYIVDAMCWRGYNMYDCSTDFRLYWLHTKLGEYSSETAAAHPPPNGWRYRFAPLPFVPADSNGALAAARQGASSPFIPDGVLFVHREALYTPCWSTPLALAWKDGGCSRYVVDTDADGTPTPVHVLVLAVSQSGELLVTDDEPPVAMSTLGACMCSVPGPGGDMVSITVTEASGRGMLALPPPGSVLRLGAQPGCIAFNADGACVVTAPLTVLGPASGRRGRPDTVSKIAFQAAARAGAGVDLAMLSGAVAS